MAQSTYVPTITHTDAQAFAFFGGVLEAIATQNSGATEPSETFAFQQWADTATGLMKIRNAANSGWITQGPLDGGFSGTGAAQYTVMPTGLVVQAGPTSVGSGGGFIAFPIAFPNQCFSVVASHEGIIDVNATIGVPTTTNFFLRMFDQTGTLIAAGGRYIAIGY